MDVHILLGSDEGATAVEYGVLVAVIALVIVMGVAAFGGALNDFFESFLPQLPFG
ncbi:MAG: Flp family type IVb pilin [Anaerosomatales bacterium]